jgi:Protein of unknown function (DUF3500)
LQKEEIMDRRTFLEIAALGASTALLGSEVQAQTTGSLTAGMAQAATRFLASLTTAQRNKASFDFSSTERTRWHWTTPGAVPRNGLALRDMSTESRTLALALLRSSLSEAGYNQAVAIIALQLELGEDDGLFYVSVFGTPASAAWGWRFEGHHLSRHFTVKGNSLFLTPFFLGSWPTETASKFRAMPREEDAARELVRSLKPEQRKIAVFQETSLSQHVTQNAVRVKPNKIWHSRFYELTWQHCPKSSASLCSSEHKRISRVFALPGRVASSRATRSITDCKAMISCSSLTIRAILERTFTVFGAILQEILGCNYFLRIRSVLESSCFLSFLKP